MEGSGESPIRNQLRVRRRQSARDAADRAHEPAESHRGTGVVEPDHARHERRAYHHHDGLQDAGRNRHGHDGRIRPERCASHGTHDVGDRARADRRHADGIGISEGQRDDDADDERQDRAEAERQDSEQPGFARLHDIDLEGCRHDREVAQHRATHQTDSGKDGNVSQTFLTSGHQTSRVRQSQSHDDGDGRPVDPASREPL